MSERITYSDEEFEPFLDIKISGTGTITKLVLEEYSNAMGKKLTAQELIEMLEETPLANASEEVVYDQLANLHKGEKPVINYKRNDYYSLVGRRILEELEKKRRPLALMKRLFRGSSGLVWHKRMSQIN